MFWFGKKPSVTPAPHPTSNPAVAMTHARNATTAAKVRHWWNTFHGDVMAGEASAIGNEIGVESGDDIGVEFGIEFAAEFGTEFGVEFGVQRIPMTLRAAAPASSGQRLIPMTLRPASPDSRSSGDSSGGGGGGSGSSGGGSGGSSSNGAPPAQAASGDDSGDQDTGGGDSDIGAEEPTYGAGDQGAHYEMPLGLDPFSNTVAFGDDADQVQADLEEGIITGGTSGDIDEMLANGLFAEDPIDPPVQVPTLRNPKIVFGVDFGGDYYSGFGPAAVIGCDTSMIGTEHGRGRHGMKC